MTPLERYVLRLVDDSFLGVVERTIVAETPDLEAAISRTATAQASEAPFVSYGDEELVWWPGR